MEHWYTLYTKPNSEYEVVASLEERGLQTYLPEIKSPKARGRKPFFPCYLFVRIDLEVTGLSKVQWTPGLRRIVAFDDRPVPLSDEVIDTIKRRLDGVSTIGDQRTQDFRSGEKVRITDGPLQGLLAVFDGPSSPADNVRVLLEFLGQTSRAYVSASDLEKAGSDIQASESKQQRRTRGRGRRIKSK